MVAAKWETILDETIEDNDIKKQRLQIMGRLHEDLEDFEIQCKIIPNETDLPICEVNLTVTIINPLTLKGIVISAGTIYGVCVAASMGVSLWGLAKKSYDDSSEETKELSKWDRLKDTFRRLFGKRQEMRSEALRVLKECLDKVKKKIRSLVAKKENPNQRPAPDEDDSDGNEDNE